MFQDLRYSVRLLLKNPAFTLIAILTLALGIGANTAIFTLLDKVLIRTLPVENPQQLVGFVEDAAGTPRVFSYPAYTDLRDRSEVLSGLVAFFQQPFSVSNGNQTERVIGQIVSGNYFAVLGVRPALGRFFADEEDRTPGTHPVAVISHALWQRRFGAAPSVLGTTIVVNGYRYTIVGVAPSEFTGITRATVSDVYLPLMMQAETQGGCPLDNSHCGWLSVIGRVKPGVSGEQAQAALAVAVVGDRERSAGHSSAFLIDGSRGYTDRVNDLSLPLKLLMDYMSDQTIHVRTALDANTVINTLRREVQALDPTLPLYNPGTLEDQQNGSLYAEHIAATLLTLFGFVALVLAAIGIYGLLSHNVTERTREIGIRLAQGAQRADLVKLIVGHGMLLTSIGVAVGLLASFALTRVIAGLLFGVSTTDPITFATIPLLLVVVALIACWVPARRATRMDPVAALRRGDA